MTKPALIATHCETIAIKLSRLVLMGCFISSFFGGFPTNNARAASPNLEVSVQTNAAAVTPASFESAPQELEPAVEARPKNHPLLPVLRLAEQGKDSTGEIHDYTCTIFKRERIKGRLMPTETIQAKIRRPHVADGEHKPYSVYLKFAGPSSVKGREVLYVQGEHDDKMLIRRGGQRMAYITTYLATDSDFAMAENRYPITEIDFQRVVGRLIDVVKEDMNYGECSVQFFKNASIGDQKCTRIVVEHPHRRDHFQFHRAIVFVDEERQLPLAYASYTWPEHEGGKPVLIEEYVYANVQLNVGLADSDFHRDNPTYGFLRDDLVAQD